MFRTAFLLAPTVALLTACAETGGAGDDAYATPAWTRDWCYSRNWRLQGAEDAARYADAERRLAALERACSMHMRVPREDYLEGFASAAGSNS